MRTFKLIPVGARASVLGAVAAVVVSSLLHKRNHNPLLPQIVSRPSPGLRKIATTIETATWDEEEGCRQEEQIVSLHGLVHQLELGVGRTCRGCHRNRIVNRFFPLLGMPYSIIVACWTFERKH